ncbi:MAG: integrin alpha, partial [Myxococcota bacterium]|nr:integrin alpha [Myxococcota bacterium]
GTGPADETGTSTETGVPPAPRPTAPSGTRTGSQDAGRFGIAVTTVPDADGDGRPEWVSAASAVGTMRQGAVWTGSGLPSSDGAVVEEDAIARGEVEMERLGQALANIGDQDGDGLAELVLGGIHMGDPRRMHGGVRIIWGTGARNTLLGDGMMEHSGWAVASSGPQREAVLVGTPYRRSADDALDARGFPETLGRVYILDDLQASALSEGSVGLLEGAGSWAGFGAAVAGTDLDGDGLDDALVGIPNGASTDGTIGRVVWYAGPLTGTRTIDDRDGIWEGAPGDHLGFAIAADADLDGDGYTDAAFGAYKAGASVDDAGAVVVVDGATRQVSGRLAGDRTGAMLGASIAMRPLPDGRAELLAGAPGWRVDGRRAGAVARHIGRVEGVVSVDGQTLLTSPGPRAEFGHDIHARRDLDGDGTADIIVGAPGWSTNDARTGAVFFFQGGTP